MVRVVLDTNILVAGLRSRQGASFQVLKQIGDRRITPLLTISLFLEYEAVLKRPEHAIVHRFAAKEIDEILAEIAALGEPVDVHFLWRPQLTDPSDEMVLEAMVNGRGDALITHNVQDFEKAAGRFGVNLLTPAQFLQGRGQ